MDRAATAGPCRVDCLHRSSVAAYRDAKTLSDEALKLAREAALYVETDMDAWDAAHRPLTFKAWLSDRKVLTDPHPTDRFGVMDEMTEQDEQLAAMSIAGRGAWLDEYESERRRHEADTTGEWEWRNR